MNREAWLEAAVAKLRPVFIGAGYTLPEIIRVSVGWPSAGGLANKKRVIGQCWYGQMSKDKNPQLFISPLLDQVTDPAGVLPTLVHEIGHVAAGADAKHGPRFKTMMKKVGLEGKPTATTAGADLIERLIVLAEELGPFPHSCIIPVKVPKTQTTRMRKITCETTGYLVRSTKKWIEEIGVPICPCCNVKMKLDELDGGE